MKITITKEISVTPILVKDSSKKNAERIGEIFSAVEDLSIFDHKIISDGLVIFIEGNIGNRLDNLLIQLADIDYDSSSQVAFCYKYHDAKKVANIIDDAKAEEKEKGKYGDLDKNLTSIYS